VKLDTIGLLIGGAGVVLLMIVVVMTIMVPRHGPRNRRYNEQRAAVREFFAKAPGSTLEFDWAGYGEVPKPEIILLAGKHSWQFADDKLTDEGWTLRFTKSQ
jgi:hypothetical protein